MTFISLRIFEKHILTSWSKQYARCFSHEPSLVAFAPTSLLWLSGRASGLQKVIGLTSFESTRMFIPSPCESPVSMTED